MARPILRPAKEPPLPKIQHPAGHPHDHYCYIHYRDDDGWRKTDVALPLKEVLQQIPSPFLLIHRSHVVNPVHLKRVERDNRAYRLILTNDVVLPISRQRLNDVLPKVRAYLDSG